jgi:hypothetical protein
MGRIEGSGVMKMKIHCGFSFWVEKVFLLLSHCSLGHLRDVGNTLGTQLFKNGVIAKSWE